MGMAYIDNWLLFSILFGLLLIVIIIMKKQSENFYTKDPIVRKFSIMELEVPATPKELANIIKGLYDLPDTKSGKSIKALKEQLKIDFLFMPLSYGCIFLLCWRVANKMQLDFGYYLFKGLAFIQLVPLICDIIENIYLLGKIRQDVKETIEKKHKQYLWMEAVKWGIALTATVCSVSAVCYFWLTGNYSVTSFFYLLIILVEIVIFLIVVKLFLK